MIPLPSLRVLSDAGKAEELWTGSRDEFEEIPGDGEGWGSLEYCSPRRRKDSDTTE